MEDFAERVRERVSRAAEELGFRRFAEGICPSLDSDPESLSRALLFLKALYGSRVMYISFWIGEQKDSVRKSRR